MSYPNINPLKNNKIIQSFLHKDICEKIIKEAESFGKWTINRHKQYPTTDIPIDNIKKLKKIKKNIITNTISLIKKNYNLECDSILDVYDLFVVKYSISGQRGLDIHRDQSEFSFIILLSDPNDFEGGGTYYDEEKLLINPDKQGTLVIHFGKTKHGGKNITKGTRYILTGFLKTKSCKLMIPNKKDDKKLSDKTLCDKRYYDFYWIGYNIKPIKILVKIINLEYRKDKLENIMTCINRLKIPNEITFTVEKYNANTGDKGTPYVNWEKFYDRKEIPTSIKSYYSRKITKGEIGCFNSHTNIIKSCNNTEYLLILEDDAEFDSDFVYRLNQAINELKDIQWDAIDFGGISIDQHKDIKITDSIVKKNNTFQTHCVLYSSSGISKINKINTNNNIIPYDDFLNTIRGIHYINELNNNKINFIMYHYYIQLSNQNSNGIHDTVNNSDSINIVNSPISTITDDYDLINWYRYSNISDITLNNIKNLCIKANKCMWNFHILNINGSFVKQNIIDWELPIDKTKKITIIISLENNCSLEIFSNNIKKIDIQKNSIIFFPSYLMFKCTNSMIFYANGDTFK
tara:strand:- start:1448 stop:3172 length:1725 start_codon:yes stop_codon:yes gene_type:complete